MATLKLKNVNKIYPNGVQAVFDFNIEVKDKEFIVFVGPSGCGKSTTLRMIAGLESITSGDLYINGELMNSVEPKDRNIAMVFQNYALYPHFTVYGNLKFALKLRKVPKPIYSNLEDPEIVSLMEENKKLFAEVNVLNKKFKKKQFDDELIASRRNIYNKIFENEDKLQSLLRVITGKDEYGITYLNKLIAKRNKQVLKNEKIIKKYKEDFPEEVKRLEETNENNLKQIEAFKEKLAYLEVNEVPLYNVRHLTRYEMDLEINKVCESINLEKYTYRKPAALSGGQRQRVALGRAIVRKPAVFLMDEPLSNLDAKLRVQTRSEIIKIHQKVGATTIYVTHDQTEAMTMADRIVVMKDGYVQQIGSPKELFMDPANKFVASFIGSPAMNFVRGKYSKGIFTGIQAETNNPLGLNNFVYEVSKEAKEILKDYEDKEIYLGVRPEDIKVALGSNNAKNSFNVDCNFVEMLGYDLMVYTYLLGNKFVIKTDESTNIKTDSKANITLDETKVLFFDGDTELRIK